MNYKVNTLRMFEFWFVGRSDVESSKAPTTTKWIDRVRKNDNGREFMRYRLVTRDFKPRGEGRLVRGDATAGGEESNCLHTLQGCVRGGPGRSETHVRRRAESALRRSGGRCDRGCANGTTLRCVAFLAVKIVVCARLRYWEEFCGGQRKGWSTKRATKHRQALLEGLGLSEEPITVNSAAAKPEEIGQEEDTNMLDEAERKKFRSFAAALSYMSLDRSDAQYAAKEICTKMANPTQGSWKRLKKAARYLKETEKVTWAMRAWEQKARSKGRCWHNAPTPLDVLTLSTVHMCTGNRP